MYAKIVEELVIYQIGLQLAEEINKLVKQIPHYWGIVECGQILRSSSSVSANIAEGFSQKFYPKQFIKYLYIAMGSSDESKDHIKKLMNNDYIEIEIAENYLKRYKGLSIKIVKLINHLRKKHNIKWQTRSSPTAARPAPREAESIAAE